MDLRRFGRTGADRLEAGGWSPEAGRLGGFGKETDASLLALLLPGGTQIVIGNVVEPEIMGDSLDIHSVTLLAALIFWGMLWGIVGMFLAVPITAILKILLERYSYTRPFACILAGKFEKWDL